MTLTGLSRTVWVMLPRTAAKLSRTAAFALADGHYLTAFGRVAGWLPPALAMVGVLAGATTLAYSRVFSEALWLVLLATAVGFLSTSLGAWLVAGYAIGDFLVGQRTWILDPTFGGGPLGEGILAGLVRVRVPMLIGYALLFLLVVLLPRLTRSLIADIPQVNRLPRPAAFGLGALLNVVVVAIAVRLWAEAAAVMIRPLFTWQRSSPTDPAAVTLQERGDWIVAVAVAALLVRYAVLWWVGLSRRRVAALAGVEAALAAGSFGTPLSERPPKAVRAVLAAAVTTLLVAGLIGTWLLALVMFSSFLVIRLVQDRVVPLPLDRWRRIAAQVPVLIRLAVALLVIDTLRRAFVEEYAATFTPLALFLVVTVAVLALLLPGPPGDPGAEVPAGGRGRDAVTPGGTTPTAGGA